MDNKRDKFISVRLTQEELDKLKELAYQSRVSVSEYIRRLLFDDYKKEGLFDGKIQI